MSMLVLGGSANAGILTLLAADDPIYPGIQTDFRSVSSGSPYGSLTPGSWSGAAVAECFSDYSGAFFRIVFNGSHPQGFFTQLNVSNPGLGVNVTLSSASASFSQGALTYWTWSGTGLPILTPGYTFQLSFT